MLDRRGVELPPRIRRAMLLPILGAGLLGGEANPLQGQQRAETIQQLSTNELSGARLELALLPLSAEPAGHRMWKAAGMAGGVVLLAPFDLQIANAFRSLHDRGGPLETGANFFRLVGFPGTVVAAGTLLGGGQITGREHLSSLGMYSVQAIVASELVTYSGKALLGRRRPLASEHDPYDFALFRGLQGGDFRSFPSGHTTAAFAVVSVLSTELGERHPGSARWVTPVLYTTAVLAGASRMYHDEHWSSDVAGGALVGTVAGWATTEYHRRRKR
jgi:membrane-associated phospholipid phosphatase